MLFDKYRILKIQQKASISYIFASLLSKSVSFITLPLFTRILSTAEIGVSTTFNSWDAIFYALVTLSLCSSSVNVAMMEYKDRRDKYQSACLTLSTISVSVFAIIYIICNVRINSFTTLSSPLMGIMILYLIFNPALDIWYARQRYEFKYKSVVVISVISSLLSAIISIGAVLLAKESNIQYLGTVRVISQYSVLIIIDVFIYIMIMKTGRTFYNKEMWLFALKLSIPMIFHTLSKSVLDMSDRLMIAAMCGKSQAGIYGTIYNISTMSLIIWNAINRSLIPTMFENLQDNKYELMNRILIKLLLVYGGVSIVLTLCAPEILALLTTSDYYEAVYIIPAISAGIYLTALYNIFVNMLMYKKKSLNIMIATIIAAIVNISLNYVCIPKYGYMAAAYTTLISFLILALLQGWMQGKVYSENTINKKAIYFLTGIVILLCILCIFTYTNKLVRYIIILIIVFVGIINKRKILVL